MPFVAERPTAVKQLPPPVEPLRFHVKGFTIVDNTALGELIRGGASRSAICLYMVLCQYSYGDKAEAYPGTARLMRDTGLSRGSVKRARRELEDMRLIEREQRSPVGTVRYHLPTLAHAKGGHPCTEGGGSPMTPGGVTHDPLIRKDPLKGNLKRLRRLRRGRRRRRWL